jgi:hypothetical protein
MKTLPCTLLAACTLAAPCYAATAAQPLDAAVAEALRGQPVTYVARPAAPLSSMTPGNSAFGLLGALMNSADGDKLVRENQLQDPAPALAQALLKTLASSLGAQPLPEPVNGDRDSAAELAAQGGTARYLLDVKTQWSMRYFSLDWKHYNVIYGARVRLIDVAARSVVAEMDCERESGKANAPSYDELMAKQGARLKREMAIGANTCLQTVRSAMLRQPPGDDAAVAVEDDTPSVSDPVPYLTAKGQERFRTFLGKPLPRAFAISDNGYSASVSGTHPENPAYPTDPQQRALQICREYAGRECRLYMVDERIVYHR